MLVNVIGYVGSNLSVWVLNFNLILHASRNCITRHADKCSILTVIMLMVEHPRCDCRVMCGGHLAASRAHRRCISEAANKCNRPKPQLRDGACFTLLTLLMMASWSSQISDYKIDTGHILARHSGILG